MGPSPDLPISDPLIRPGSGPRGALGKPVRAPLGNSMRTFLVFVVLIIIGGVIWWLSRPDDLSDSVGGREWTITDIDGEPATNQAGTMSTFVLDGNGEVRAPDACNVVTGEWRYDSKTSRLTIDWEDRTMLACGDDWPVTYQPFGGEVDIDDGVMQITTDTAQFRAVSLAERPTALVDDVAGTWVSGDRSVEIGQHGRFHVDECEGSWEGLDEEAAEGAEGAAMTVDFDDLQRDDCTLDPMWRDEALVVPVLDGDAIYLRRDRSIYPIDRAVVRLDPEL